MTDYSKTLEHLDDIYHYLKADSDGTDFSLGDLSSMQEAMRCVRIVQQLETKQEPLTEEQKAYGLKVADRINKQEAALKFLENTRQKVDELVKEWALLLEDYK